MRRKTSVLIRILLATTVIVVGNQGLTVAQSGVASSTKPSWQGTLGEEINTYYGDLTYPVTDLAFNTRGGLGIQITRIYNSNLYGQQSDTSNPGELCIYQSVPTSKYAELGGRTFSDNTYKNANTGFGPGWVLETGMFLPGNRYDSLFPDNPSPSVPI